MKSQSSAVVMLVILAVAVSWIVFSVNATGSSDRYPSPHVQNVGLELQSEGLEAKRPSRAPDHDRVDVQDSGSRFVIIRVVEDVSGTPISGASVFVVDRGRRTLSQSDSVTRVKSDAQGYARLEPEHLDGKKVGVVKSRFVPVEVESPSWGATYRVVMRHARGYELAFTDRGGMPVSEVGVRLSKERLEYGAWPAQYGGTPCGSSDTAVFESMSDSAGIVRFESLDQGTYWVSTCSQSHVMIDHSSMRKIDIDSSERETIMVARLFGFAVAMRGDVIGFRFPPYAEGSIRNNPLDYRGESLTQSRSLLRSIIQEKYGQAPDFYCSYVLDYESELAAIAGELDVSVEAQFTNRELLRQDINIKPFDEVSLYVFDEDSAARNSEHGHVRVEVRQPDGSVIEGFSEFHAKSIDRVRGPLHRVEPFKDRGMLPGRYRLFGPPTLSTSGRTEFEVLPTKTTTCEVRLEVPHAVLRIELVPDKEMLPIGCWVSMSSEGYKPVDVMVNDPRDMWLAAGREWHVVASNKGEAFYSCEVTPKIGEVTVVRVPYTGYK